MYKKFFLLAVVCISIVSVAHASEQYVGVDQDSEVHLQFSLGKNIADAALIAAGSVYFSSAFYNSQSGGRILAKITATAVLSGCCAYVFGGDINVTIGSYTVAHIQNVACLLSGCYVGAHL